jgi:ribosomal-protein-alanine N-acetyltransferase
VQVGDGPVEVRAAEEAGEPTPITPAGLAAAALLATGSGDPLTVLPTYGREPDATPPRMDVRYDELGIGDLDSLMTLERRCFPNPWTRAMYVGELQRPERDRVTLAARDAGANGRLVGAALAARIGGAWHVMNVLVDPIARQRGIARRLMEQLLERTTQLGPGDGWTLEVRDGNDAAIHLYEGFGFVNRGRRPGYYQDTGEDAFVMWREAPVEAAR